MTKRRVLFPVSVVLGLGSEESQNVHAGGHLLESAGSGPSGLLNPRVSMPYRPPVRAARIFRHLVILAMNCALVLGLGVLLLSGCKGKQEQSRQEVVPAMELFATRCTVCHGWDQASRIHGSEETLLQLVQRMIGKGASLSNREAMSIAGFLSAPSRQVFDQRCTKCHPLDRVQEAHAKGDLTRETIRRMRDKQGSGISEEEESAINGHLFGPGSGKPKEGAGKPGGS